MQWGKVIDKWLGSSKENENPIFPKKLRFFGKSNEQRVAHICEELGNGGDREAIEMLMKHGLKDQEIKEIVQASNILNCEMMGDIELEVEKLYAQKVLHEHGYTGVEEFKKQLTLYHEAHEMK